MQDRHNEQMVEIRDQIALLQSDAKRLKVLIHSKFTSEQYKVRARADLKNALEKLKDLQHRFAR